MKKIFFLLVALGFLYLMFVFFNLLPVIRKEDNKINVPTKYLRMSELGEISSEFKCNYNNLYRVEVELKNPILLSKDEFEVIVEDLNDKKEIIRTTFNGFNVGDPSPVRIGFPVIQNSQNHKYILKIKLTKKIDGNLEAGFRNDNLIISQFYKPGWDLRFALNESNRYLSDLFNSQAIVGAFILISLILFLW
jgi:hypothetical protein